MLVRRNSSCLDILFRYSKSAILKMPMDWTVETLNTTVDKELESLPADMRARFMRISELIAAVGLENVGAPHVKHLTGPLWEMRRDIPRALRRRSG